MRYAVGEYALAARIRYAIREYAIGPREYDMWYANTLWAARIGYAIGGFLGHHTTTNCAYRTILILQYMVVEN